MFLRFDEIKFLITKIKKIDHWSAVAFGTISGSELMCGVVKKKKSMTLIGSMIDYKNN